MKNVGGQAVIEGVMMKSPEGWSVAVRNPEGGICLKTVETEKSSGFRAWPFVRGTVALGQALSIGIKAIEFSGSVAYREKEDEKPMSSVGMTITIAAAIILAIGLFKFLPLLLATLLGRLFADVSRNSLIFNIADGVFRLCVFFLYISAIGLWKEMRRVYEYHGAEHKVIYTFEAGEELTVENAKKYKPYHPRCGTSFLLIVMMISILMFLFIPQQWSFAGKLAARLALLPLLAGISYEVLRFSAKLKDNPVIGLLVLPGLLLQRLTVREPDNAQIEVALSALKEVLKLDGEEKKACAQC